MGSQAKKQLHREKRRRFQRWIKTDFGKAAKNGKGKKGRTSARKGKGVALQRAGGERGTRGEETSFGKKLLKQLLWKEGKKMTDHLEGNFKPFVKHKEKALELG